MTTENRDALIADAARILRGYLDTGRDSTAALRELADRVAALRLSHTLDDGRPDLGGRSTAYRQSIAEVYRRAGVPRDDYDGIQSALRYHLSNRLHAIRTGEELTAAGMSDRPARERRAADRAAAAELRAALRDPVALVAHIAALSERIDAEALLDEDATRRAAARMGLCMVRDAADAAVAALDAGAEDAGR